MYILDKSLRNYKKLDTVLWFFQMLVGCKNCMEAIFQFSVKFCICTLTQDSNFEVSKHNSYLMEEDWSLHPPPSKGGLEPHPPKEDIYLPFRRSALPMSQVNIIVYSFFFWYSRTILGKHLHQCKLSFFFFKIRCTDYTVRVKVI